MKRLFYILLLIILFGTSSINYAQVISFNPNDTILKRKKNIVSINLFEPLLGRVAFAYERIIANSRVGLWIPLTIGIQPYKFKEKWSNLGISNKIVALGFGIKLYLPTDKKLKFYLCPNYEMAKVLYKELVEIPYSIGYPPHQTTSYTTQKIPQIGYFSSVAIDAGFIAHMNSSFWLNLYLGLGYKVIDGIEEDDIGNQSTVLTVKMFSRTGINLAYRFR